jgi:hypothetical protein
MKFSISITLLLLIMCSCKSENVQAPSEKGTSSASNSSSSSAQNSPQYKYKFVRSANMSDSRFGHFCALLPSGKVVLGGGSSTGGSYLSSVEIFDPKTGEFSASNSLPETFSGSAVSMLDGRILVFGRSEIRGEGYSFIIDEAKNLVTPIQTPIKIGNRGLLLEDGRVAIFSHGTFSILVIYDPNTNSYYEIEGEGNFVSANQANSTTLNLLQTNPDGLGSYTNKIKSLNLSTLRLTDGESIDSPTVLYNPIPNYLNALQTLSFKSVEDVYLNSYFQILVAFDWPTLSFKELLEVPDNWLPNGVALDNGEILLYSVFTNNWEQPILKAKIFTPSGTLRSISDPTNNRNFPCVVRLNDGRLFLSGGITDRPVITTEIFE